MKHILHRLFSSFMVTATLTAWSAEPSGYYTSCEGKSGKNLLNSLYQTITDHTNVGYDGLLDLYKTSDVYPDGTIWDMYSTKHWTFGKTCGNYKNVGDCYNREHSFPKSWFNDASPMYSDAFHIYPTDGKVNGQRSNYPYGECSGGTTLSAPAGIEALGKLGTSTFPGYTGKVFEPVDEYKGDFARSYFYMAACYNDRIAGWNSDMLAGNNYPCFSGWALNLLLKWHRQDPVSEKERNRNEAVYARQHNRNPFIDHPDLVEYIWGDKTSGSWSADASVDPTFNSPAPGSSINLGNVSVNGTLTSTLSIKGTALATNATVSISDPRFTLSATTLSSSALNSDTGAPLTITFRSATAGTVTAAVSVTAGPARLTFNVVATAHSSLTALAPLDVTDRSFTARWVNIDPAGTIYQLHVTTGGTPLPGYPVSVDASAQSYLVDNLEPATDYAFFLESPTLTSNTVPVTTAEAIPSVSFLFDGDLEFYTSPGQPSEEAEILVDVDNIAGDVIVKVTKPFEISTDRATWSQSVTLVAGSDRFYMRVNSDQAGVYTTSLIATAPAIGYYNDDTTVKAIVGESDPFYECFSNEAPSYGTTTYVGTACNWIFSDAGVWATDADSSLPEGCLAVRLGKTDTSSIAMDEDKAMGIGTVTFYAQPYHSDSDALLHVEISADHGSSWEEIGHVTVTGSGLWTKFDIPVNRAGELRLRLRQSSGKRVLLSRVSLSDYLFSGLNQTLGYHSWDAYCRDGRLVIDVVDRTHPCQVAVYDMAGMTCFNGRLGATTALELPAGLYIVVVDNFARRVVVN